MKVRITISPRMRERIDQVSGMPPGPWTYTRRMPRKAKKRWRKAFEQIVVRPAVEMARERLLHG